MDGLDVQSLWLFYTCLLHIVLLTQTVLSVVEFNYLGSESLTQILFYNGGRHLAPLDTFAAIIGCKVITISELNK